MIKLYIKEAKQLSEAELRAPDSFVNKLMDSIEKKYLRVYNPKNYTIDSENRKVLTNLNDFTDLIPPQMSNGVQFNEKIELPLEELVYTNNKNITNGLVIFYAMNALANNRTEAADELENLKKFWNPKTKQFSPDIIEKAKKFPYPIYVSLQSTKNSEIMGFATHSRVNENRIDHVLNICFMNLTLRSIKGSKNLYIIDSNEALPKIKRTVEHEIRHIIQFINEKCVRYGNEARQFADDLSQIRLISNIRIAFPATTVMESTLDFETLKYVLDEETYDADYKVSGKEKHKRLPDNSYAQEFFGLGKNKLDLKDVDIDLLQRIGWSEDEVYDRYFKTDTEYHSWMGDLLSKFEEAASSLETSDEKFLKLLKKGSYNAAAIYLIKSFMGGSSVRDIIKDKNFIQFFTVAKVFRKQAFINDLVNDLTLRLEKKYKEKYTKIDKQKKSLKEMTKYRKIFLKLKNSMSR